MTNPLTHSKTASARVSRKSDRLTLSGASVSKSVTWNILRCNEKSGHPANRMPAQVSVCVSVSAQGFFSL
nr:MAG TPA: hypothetical protein [Bacteriophage sp.]